MATMAFNCFRLLNKNNTQIHIRHLGHISEVGIQDPNKLLVSFK